VVGGKRITKHVMKKERVVLSIANPITRQIVSAISIVGSRKSMADAMVDI